MPDSRSPSCGAFRDKGRSPMYRATSWLLLNCGCLAVLGGSSMATGGAAEDRNSVKGQPKARTDAHGAPLPRGAVARIGSMRLWLGHPCISLVYSSDGKRLAAAHQDGRSCIWEMPSGKEL